MAICLPGRQHNWIQHEKIVQKKLSANFSPQMLSILAILKILSCLKHQSSAYRRELKEISNKQSVDGAEPLITLK